MKSNSEKSKNRQLVFRSSSSLPFRVRQQPLISSVGSVDNYSKEAGKKHAGNQQPKQRNFSLKNAG
jgi:hypothetical protein